MLPKRYSASLEGWHWAGVRLSFSSISSMTARPPVCSRKCSNAPLNLGMYPFCMTTFSCTDHRHLQALRTQLERSAPLRPTLDMHMLSRQDIAAFT